MRILMIGDIVGSPGRKALLEYLPRLKRSHHPDLVVVNGENAADGRGITRSIAREFFGSGVDCITLGNHTWDKREIFDFIDGEKRIVRPANYPEGTPGQGYARLKFHGGELVVINLMGRSFLSNLDCPFREADAILKKLKGNPPVLVDFHAETTSEKLALAWYLDGRVSAVIGTHTHVQTADERILPKGTAYLTDVGMVGPYDSVLGMNKDLVIKKFLTQLPVRFEVSKGRVQFNAVLIDLDLVTGKSTRIDRLRFDDDKPWFE
ncbi:metallophosphoesterase [Kroppenstedtia guangzhouensis]|uniref:Metallophosphoesterase n=1 Tax=Kroppenstedtia guangzhouensis TaxID=1274356 RepID=A0ABQ1FZV4_9BACL|nr:TIGR00282 family metallophosphoesterase [Kroppenstedtia guangzhouensis]GGA34702.1 metallophosphoesterase [Kroppenstedtia guangzhouensis]